MKKSPLFKRLAIGALGAVATLQSASAVILVNDTTFTANGSTASGGYIYASAVGSPTLTGGATLAFATTNTGAQDPDFSIANRRFTSQAIAIGDTLSLSFDFVSGPAFTLVRSFGFGFVGNSAGGMPTTDQTNPIFSPDDFYSLAATATRGGSQYTLNGLRSDFNNDNTGNPLQLGGILGGASENVGNSLTDGARVAYSITRVADTGGKAQYSVLLQIGTGDTRAAATLSSNGAATDLLSFDGIFFGTGGALSAPANPNFTIDNVMVNYMAVPEPSTFAMLLGGLGMLTLQRRRRY